MTIANMKTYIITEKQNLNSSRVGEQIEAKDLTSAKRKASKIQVYHGTVMTIEDETGHMLAYKQYETWVNND